MVFKVCTLTDRIVRLAKGDKQFWKRDIDRKHAADGKGGITEVTPVEMERGKESSSASDEKKSD